MLKFTVKVYFSINDQTKITTKHFQQYNKVFPKCESTKADNLRISVQTVSMKSFVAFPRNSVRGQAGARISTPKIELVAYIYVPFLLSGKKSYHPKIKMTFNIYLILFALYTQYLPETIFLPYKKKS